MAICFSLLPLVLGAEGIDERLIWKIGGAGIIAWYIGIAIYRTRQCRRLGVPLAIPVLLRFWVAIVGVLQFVNIFSSGYAWPYLLGVFSLLVNGFSVFLMLLLSPQEKPNAIEDG